MQGAVFISYAAAMALLVTGAVPAVAASGSATQPLASPSATATANTAGSVMRGLPSNLTVYCRGGGNNALSYHVAPGYMFVVAFSPGFQQAGPQFPHFGLGAGQCGFTDNRYHSEPHSLCFQTGSLEAMEYFKSGFAELKTTPDVVGGMIQSNYVYGFSVRVVNGCLVVDKYEGPLNN